MVWETFGKHPPARWQQSFSNISDPLAFLENDLKIHVLLAALAVAVASLEAVSVAVAVASLDNLKIQLSMIETPS